MQNLRSIPDPLNQNLLFKQASLCVSCERSNMGSTGLGFICMPPPPPPHTLLRKMAPYLLAVSLPLILSKMDNKGTERDMRG